MSEIYRIRRLQPDAPIAQDENGKLFGLPEGLEEAPITRYVNTPDSFRPYNACRMGWDENGLYVYEYSFETALRTAGIGTACKAWCDSCLEVFLAADESRPNLYLNYECTAAPYVYMAIGESRQNRRLYTELPDGMEPQGTVLPGIGWCIRYTIPLSFLREAFGVNSLHAGMVMRGNFQKCGDETQVPHWATWSEIQPRPDGKWDFHQPQYFGKIVLG